MMSYISTDISQQALIKVAMEGQTETSGEFSMGGSQIWAARRAERLWAYSQAASKREETRRGVSALSWLGETQKWEKEI